MVKRLAAIAALVALLVIGSQLWEPTNVIGLQPVPDYAPEDVTYLGQGGRFTIPEGRNFIVKRLKPFRFDLEPGPVYNAAPREDVWSTTGDDAPPAEFHETVDFGFVQEGCIVRFLAIDDNVDDRINRFFLGDELIYTMEQGMVTTGRFVIPEGGQLTLEANDSIGAWLGVCNISVTETPEPPPTAAVSPPAPTATNTAVSTDTPTAVPTNTTTATPPVTPSNTPTGTLTATVPPTATPTNTPTPPGGTAVPPTPTASATPPGGTVSPPQLTPTASPSATPPGGTEIPPEITPTASPTVAKTPRQNACFLINFEVGPDEARRGLYVVQDVGGGVLGEWYALDGWTSSQWIREVDIAFPSVYVRVLYYSGPGAEPFELDILNPAPGEPYGWVGRGMCHAIEVAFP